MWVLVDYFAKIVRPGMLVDYRDETVHTEVFNRPVRHAMHHVCSGSTCNALILNSPHTPNIFAIFSKSPDRKTIILSRIIYLKYQRISTMISLWLRTLLNITTSFWRSYQFETNKKKQGIHVEWSSRGSKIRHKTRRMLCKGVLWNDALVLNDQMRMACTANNNADQHFYAILK